MSPRRGEAAGRKGDEAMGATESGRKQQRGTQIGDSCIFGIGGRWNCRSHGSRLVPSEAVGPQSPPMHVPSSEVGVVEPWFMAANHAELRRRRLIEHRAGHGQPLPSTSYSDPLDVPPRTHLTEAPGPWHAPHCAANERSKRGALARFCAHVARARPRGAPGGGAGRRRGGGAAAAGAGSPRAAPRGAASWRRRGRRTWREGGGGGAARRGGAWWSAAPASRWRCVDVFFPREGWQQFGISWKMQIRRGGLRNVGRARCLHSRALATHLNPCTIHHCASQHVHLVSEASCQTSSRGAVLLPRFWSKLAKLFPSLAEFGHVLAEFDKHGPRWAEVGRAWPNVGQFRSMFGSVLPNPANIRPKLNQIRPTSTNVVRSRAIVDQTRPNSIN